MRVCGIVCEYNPFHLGHKRQIDILKYEYGVDLVIGVMSGNFVQRGEPALIDKWTRAKMAIDSGMDLIVELPLVFAISSADDFALGAVKVLSMLGIESLSFGHELEDNHGFDYYATLRRSEEYNEALRDMLNQGYSYGTASNKILSELTSLNISSNTILALSYMDAVKKLGLELNYLPIKREGAAYRDGDNYRELASALAIRNALFKKTVDWQQIEAALPPASHKYLFDMHKYVHPDDISKLLLSRVFRLKKEGLRNIRGVIEGLENRIYDVSMTNPIYTDFAAEVSSKRYSEATVKRIFLNILFGIEKRDISFDVNTLDYVRVLGSNPAGRSHLAKLCRGNDVKILSNLARDVKKLKPCSSLLAYDIEATQVYSLVYEYIDANSDYRHMPYIAS